MPDWNIIQAVNDALRIEMRRDPRVVVMGEDVGKFGGVFRATAGLRDRFGVPLAALLEGRYDGGEPS